MEYEVEFTEEFEAWWDTLEEGAQDRIAEVIDLLAEHGPALRRPHSGSIGGSKHPNMKELIAQHAGEPYRVLYVFNPRRHAILLIGGKKTGNERWYEQYVPLADRIYERHLAELAREL